MHAHAVDSHPPSTSSALGARESVCARGLSAFPANTEVARTIASLRGMCGVDPPGRAIAAVSANTGGILVFGVFHVGTLHLHFGIEPWDYLVCRVRHVLSCCAAV